MVETIVNNKAFRILVMIFAMGLASYLANLAIDNFKEFGGVD